MLLTILIRWNIIITKKMLLFKQIYYIKKQVSVLANSILVTDDREKVVKNVLYLFSNLSLLKKGSSFI